MKIRRIKKGFTLVELVVVIAVIAILSAVSVGAYFGITDSANHSRAEAEAKAFWTEVNAAVIAGRGNTESYNVNSSRDGWTFSKYDHLTVQDLVDNATLIEQRHYVYISDNFAHAKEKEAETNNQVYFFASSYDSETTASVVKYFGYIPSNLDGKYVKYIDVVTGALVENPASNGAVVAPKTYDVYFAHRFYENAYMYAYEASVDPAPSSRINSTVLKANENEVEDEIYFKEWPGIQGTEIKNGVFKFTLDFSKKSYNTVIFNNGKDCGHQTEKFDISIEIIRETPYLNGNTGEWEAFAELNFEHHGYYLYGSMNNWQADEAYLLKSNPNKLENYITIDLKAGDKFLIGSERGLNEADYVYRYTNLYSQAKTQLGGKISEGDNSNFVVNEAGKYTIIIELNFDSNGNSKYEANMFKTESRIAEETYETTVSEEYIYFVSNVSNVHAYLWDESSKKNAAYPGKPMEKIVLNGKNAFKISKGAYKKVIFNNGKDGENNKYSGDISLSDSVNIYYDNGNKSISLLNRTIKVKGSFTEKSGNAWTDDTSYTAFELNPNEYCVTIHLNAGDVFKFEFSNKWSGYSALSDQKNNKIYYKWFYFDSIDGNDDNIVVRNGRSGTYTFFAKQNGGENIIYFDALLDIEQK